MKTKKLARLTLFICRTHLKLIKRLKFVCFYYGMFNLLRWLVFDLNGGPLASGELTQKHDREKWRQTLCDKRDSKFALSHEVMTIIKMVARITNWGRIPVRISRFDHRSNVLDFVSTALLVINSKRKAKYWQSKKAKSKITTTTTTTTTAKQNKNKVTLLAPRALQLFSSRLPEAFLGKVRWSEWG